MSNSLAGKRAFVTGSFQGIGLGIASVLASVCAYVENENTPYPQAKSLSKSLPKDSFDRAVFYLTYMIKLPKYLLDYPLRRLISSH